MEECVLKKYVVLLFAVSLLLSGCATNAIDDHAKIYDDENKLSSEASSYSYVERIGEVDENDVDLHVSFSGNEVMWDTTFDEATTLSCDYDIAITKGNFKVILVDEDKNIVTLWETGKNESTGTMDIPFKAGRNLVKIVGRKTVGNVQLHLNDE